MDGAPLDAPIPGPVNYFWLAREDKILREHYPKGGAKACHALLPGRTLGAIHNRARHSGLRWQGMPKVRQRWEPDPEIDAALKRAQERGWRRGEITRLSERAGRPRWWLQRRAIDLGLRLPPRDPAWSEEETQLLHETAHLTPMGARARFRAAGFVRTATAIKVRRTREAINVAQAGQYAGWYPVPTVAELLGEDQKRLLRWINDGELKARRRGTGHPKDPYDIHVSKLRAFIVAHPLRVQLSRIPPAAQAWFVSMLAGEVAP